MESIKTIESALDQLADLSPNGAAYFQILIDDLDPFNIEEYIRNPEYAKHSMPDLDDDISELITEINNSIRNGAPKEEIKSALKEIRSHLRSKAVTLGALKPVFVHFDIPIEGQPTETNEGPIRFHVVNLQCDRRERESFLRACGLTENTSEGSGSHTKWRDSEGKFVALTSRSGKAWLKIIIKEMLHNNFPVEKIQAACDHLGIAFTVLNR